MEYRLKYLEKQRKEKRNVLFMQVGIIVFFLISWQISAHFKIIDPFIFSSPLRILNSFITLAQKDLFYHIMVTVTETVIGFSLGIILGFLIASLMWFNSFLNKVLAPYLVVLNSLPKIALGPVIIVWAGAGIKSIIMMAVAISLIVTVLELSHGFLSVDKNYITTIKSFGACDLIVFTKLVLPYNIPIFFQSLRVNIGLSLVGVIAGEFLTSKAGLGYMIVYAGQVFEMDVVMMNVIILGIIAYGMYSLVNLAQRVVNKKINHI